MTKVALTLLLLSAVSFAAVGAGLFLGWGSSPCGTREIEVESSGDSLTATFLGDTMLGDAAAPLLEGRGYGWVFDRVAPLVNGDVVMANAEGPITTLSDSFDPAQHWHYNAQPAAAVAMADVGIDVIGLGNNHAMDRGPQGLADTIAAASRAGMVSAGAGSDICEAELPIIVRSPAGTMGVVVLGKYYGRDKMASAVGAGTVALSQASITRGAQLARAAGADWIVGYVHWGRSYDGVTAEQRTFATLFEEAGYDLVVGMHPHIAQELEFVEDMPVAYSIGNFVFGAPGRFSEERPGFGYLLGAKFSARGLESLTLQCIVTDNEVVGFQPRACDIATAARILTALNAGIMINGTKGILSTR